MSTITIPAAVAKELQREFDHHGVFLSHGSAVTIAKAMLNAWPGMKQEPETVDDHNAIQWPAAIILPLPPQENPDG